MNSIKRILVIAAFGLMTFGAVKVKAQCATCSATVESKTIKAVPKPQVDLTTVLFTCLLPLISLWLS